jgi:hypothetical protein
MSSNELKGDAQAAVDPEKGLVESQAVPVSYDGDVKAKASLDTLSKEKDAAVTTTTKEVVVAAKPSKPPSKPKKKVPLWIVWTLWFNTYRKFFTFCFTVNMVGLTLAASGHWPYGRRYAGSIVVADFFVAILMRNEIFGRFLYWFVNTFFAKWTPLWFRLGCTSVLQHLGGIHSGCAVSAVIWLIYRVVDNFRDLDGITHTSVLVLGVITNVVVFIAALSAFPWVRNTHHNVFERQHRFFGWTGIIMTWAFVVAGDLWDPVSRSWNLSGVGLLRHQDFWFIVGMTVFVALPWFFVREVPVDIELPSPKVAIIRFKRGMQQGLLGRISRSPILEYHAFGLVSESRHAKYHYMIAGVQGDFTRSLVQNPPKTIWTRELKFAGVSNTSTLYKRGIRICTGTGIGAALSTCLQSPYWYLIWIGSEQEKTFGPTISGLIHKHIEPERLLLWDSKARGGRPDSIKILKEAYTYWNAEVVFITSNYTGNTEMLQGCKENNIPCFGTLWDF